MIQKIIKKKSGETMKNKDKTPDIEKQPDIDKMELNTCSVYDCTGLIPAGVTSEGEAQAYEELYPYITPPTPQKEDKPKNNKFNQ